MSNRLKCPSCSTLFEFPKGNVRSVFPCPGCGKSFRRKPSQSHSRTDLADPFTAFMNVGTNETPRNEFAFDTNEPDPDDEFEDDSLDFSDNEISHRDVRENGQRRRPLSPFEKFDRSLLYVRFGAFILSVGGVALLLFSMFLIALFSKPDPGDDVGQATKAIAWLIAIALIFFISFINKKR